jgi:hypothetical protein
VAEHLEKHKGIIKFDEIKKDLDQHLDEFDRFQTIEEERARFQ